MHIAVPKLGSQRLFGWAGKCPASVVEGPDAHENVKFGLNPKYRGAKRLKYVLAKLLEHREQVFRLRFLSCDCVAGQKKGEGQLWQVVQ